MKHYSPWSWIGLMAGLFAVQAWIVPMVIHGATETEWLRGTPEQGGDSRPVSNDKTALAFSHCNRHLQTIEPGRRFALPSAPDREWDLGFDRYMIRASVRSADSASGTEQREYLCRIHYLGGDASDSLNWTVAGFEFTSP